MFHVNIQTIKRGEKIVSGLSLIIKPENIKQEYLNGIYYDLADLLGIDATLKIYEMYRGQQLTLPVQLFDKNFIICQIIKEYNGYNIKRLATKFGYSEKWVRKIIKDHRDEIDKENK